jgi:hypothetical protein
MNMNVIEATVSNSNKDKEVKAQFFYFQRKWIKQSILFE